MEGKLEREEELKEEKEEQQEEEELGGIAYLEFSRLYHGVSHLPRHFLPWKHACGGCRHSDRSWLPVALGTVGHGSSRKPVALGSSLESFTIALPANVHYRSDRTDIGHLATR